MFYRLLFWTRIFTIYSLLLDPNIIELSLNDSIIINEQEILLIET